MRQLEVLCKSLDRETELVGKTESPLEILEELRLTLDTFMNKETLSALWEIKEELEREPRHSEIYSYFKRASFDGEECRFAQKALKGFRENRLEKTKELLIKALRSLGE